uniref:Uncharacterized protein n=1 Tax=Anopheles atroparvus TaxID=41427 RepID=A0A182JEL0_ANOAO
MAKDTDANLAEIDIENFRTEDIRSLVVAIPSQLKSAQQQSHLRGSHRLRTVLNRLISHISRHARSCFVHKSLSMPNLQSNQLQHHLPVGQHPLNVSQAPAASHNSAELLDRSTTMLAAKQEDDQTPAAHRNAGVIL